MYFFICIACPALELFQMTCTCIHERELVEVTFSVLRFHLVEVYAACVDTYRSSGLHSSVSNPMASDRFGQLIGSPVRPFFHPVVGASTCISPLRKVPAVSTMHFALKVTPQTVTSPVTSPFSTRSSHTVSCQI